MDRIRFAALGTVVFAIVVAIGLCAFGLLGGRRGDALSLHFELGGDGERRADVGAGEPEEWFIDQRAGGPGLPLDQGAFRRAGDQARAIRSSTPPQGLRGVWQLAGPTNIGGRVVDIAVDPIRPDTLYVAVATGGVWRNTDGLVVMQKTWPDDYPQAMGALACASDGTLWAGTGEANNGGGSIVFGGDGVYRSTDGGDTWRHRGLTHSGTIGRIAVDPTNPDIVFVAAAGSLFNPGGDRGIYRSTNGGDSWRLVLPPENDFSGGIDLAIDPSRPQRIFAAMWQRRREPDLRTYGGIGSGLWRSLDGGDTWERLENVTSLGQGDAIGLARADALGRIGIALAPSNPDQVYVLTNSTNGDDRAFYISRDGGDSFQARARPYFGGGYGWYFGRLWVDPVNPNHVFAGGIELLRSTNGGASWTSAEETYFDQHAMAWSLQVARRVYLGNDGGTSVSDANGVGGWRDALYEPYTQFYSIDVGEQIPERLTGGTQDNGCLRSWDYPGSPGGPSGWSTFGCSDGEYTVIDPSDGDIFYGCSYYGSCIRRYDGPLSPPPVTNRTISVGTVSARRNWLTPLVLDPSNPAILYYGGDVLNRSVDRGSTWTRVSPPEIDLTGTFESPDRIDPKYPNYGTITTIAVSRTSPDTLYLGTDTGRVWKTEDGGATWVRFVERGLPERWVTRVAIDPEDSQTAWATFSGFRNGESAANVFRTSDGGETWEDASGNLPNAPVNDIVIDKSRGTVFVGTDVGIFALKNDRKNWVPAGIGLPLSPVLDLRLHEGSATLFAATFGRSTWKLEISK